MEPREPTSTNDDTLLGQTLASSEALLEAPGESRSPAALRPGTRIAHFELLAPLGAGGMGVVYAARDPRLDRKVALKLLAAESESPIARERLLREAQAMARLDHPNIATVHEVGSHGEGVFVAMELIDGPSLAEWLERRREEGWSERLRMVLAAGEGLAAAHAEGLVHRDFKPANVMIGPDGRPRVLDFGLVRAQDSRADASPDGDPASIDPFERTHGVADTDSGSSLRSPLTLAGAIVGTPIYMSPEQLSGARVDPRSDQFSFCVTLYEALYGQRPFGGETLAQMLSARERPPSFPERSAVPHAIAKILARGLASEPDARWPSMAELLAALHRQLARHADPERDLAVGRRQRVALLAGIIVIILTVVLVMARFDPARVLGDPWRAHNFYAFQCFAGAAIMLAARRSVGRNRINRQLLSLLLVFTLGVWLNRVVAIPLGLAWPEVYLLDLVLVAALCLLSGALIHPWLWALAGFTGACIGVGCYDAALAPAASLVANVGSLLSLILVWRGGQRDQQRAEASMRSRSSSGSSSPRA